MANTTFDNSDRGALFKNDRKQSENHPDYTGSLNADGTDYWLSAWLKKDKSGKTFMSLALRPKDEAPARANPPSKAPRVVEDDFEDSSDIPF